MFLIFFKKVLERYIQILHFDNGLVINCLQMFMKLFMSVRFYRTTCMLIFIDSSFYYINMGLENCGYIYFLKCNAAKFNVYLAQGFQTDLINL